MQWYKTLKIVNPKFTVLNSLEIASTFLTSRCPAAYLNKVKHLLWYLQTPEGFLPPSSISSSEDDCNPRLGAPS